jgi:hypothetical protein
MTFTHEYLTRSRQQELMREAQRARLARCLQQPRPWRRRSRRPCA